MAMPIDVFRAKLRETIPDLELVASALLNVYGLDNQSDTALVGDRHLTVTLCGSSRFKELFNLINHDLTLRGFLVISLGVFGHAEGVILSAHQKAMLDQIHRQKIDMADAILVVNFNGYIGESTQKEIDYARAEGKVVAFLFDPSYVVH